MAERYHHIAIDKLADAFEKQFLHGLPEFGKFTQNDQQMSPESLKNRQIQLGITGEEKQKSFPNSQKSSTNASKNSSLNNPA